MIRSDVSSTETTRGQPSQSDLLERLVASEAESFAMISRANGPGGIEILAGKWTELDQLDDLTEMCAVADTVVMIPFRQIVERGYSCIDDHSPLLAMAVEEREIRNTSDVISALPLPSPLPFEVLRFDVSDTEHQNVVRAVIVDEIGAGAGSNFVISRSLVGSVGAKARSTAFGLFRRLLCEEEGDYWTFMVVAGERIFVGASPEAHLVVESGVAKMNPISGTFRYPPGGPAEPDVLEFLANTKENDELFMVVDEELKMMSTICERGATALGPNLKEMSHLAHTEYELYGETQLGVADLLRQSMFAPTVVGSPLENAARVIERHEERARGYYSGVIAHIERGNPTRPEMDSAILIRTAMLDSDGNLRITAGSTLVRDSDPATEMRETSVKLASLTVGRGDRGRAPELALRPGVRAALRRRNAVASPFWFADSATRFFSADGMIGSGDFDHPYSGRVLLLDAEDNFTAMLATMLRGFGFDVSIEDCTDSRVDVTEYDLVVLGPGPGDPNCRSDRRVAAIEAHIVALAGSSTPFVAVCLSHQILCRTVGLGIDRLAEPNQGVARSIDYLGRDVRVGFYNSYVARCTEDVLDSELLGRVRVARDGDDHQVFGLRGLGFESFQFHTESVLSRDGSTILAAVLDRLAGSARVGYRRSEVRSIS